MRDFVDIVGLRDLLAGARIAEGTDFESIYDELVSSGRNRDLAVELERRVFDYFAAMRSPPVATIYDMLILSLRKKDLIATFNWDPFLMQASRRNMHIACPPQLVFLHGNVGCGVCHQDRQVGFAGQACPVCGKPFPQRRLLYPVRQKNDNQDPFIAGEWQRFRRFLNDAYMVTIFGSSAPAADLEARELMLDVWRNNPSRELAQVEIVDVKPERQLRSAWGDFFVSHHYGIAKTIHRTYLSWFPRRSCEALYSQTMMLRPPKTNPIPRFRNLARLQSWTKALVAEENRCEKEGQALWCELHPDTH
jgi:hypothetical protein